jgi:hypothetical protein
LVVACVKAGGSIIKCGTDYHPFKYLLNRIPPITNSPTENIIKVMATILALYFEESLNSRIAFL